MKGYLIEAENKPGALAEIGEAIAAAGINVTGGAATTAGGRGGMVVMTNDHEKTRTVLNGLSYTFREIGFASATLADEPGSLAAAARKLANAGVNVEALVLTGRDASGVTVAFGVDDVAAAEQALG